MLDFFLFIDNIFVEIGGLVFRQTIGRAMNTNCAPLLAYETDFRQGFYSRINIEN